MIHPPPDGATVYVAGNSLAATGQDQFATVAYAGRAILGRGAAATASRPVRA